MIAELVLAAWFDSVPKESEPPSEAVRPVILCDHQDDIMNIIQFVTQHNRKMYETEYPASCEKVPPDPSWTIEVLVTGTKNGLTLELLQVETRPGVFQYGFGVHLNEGH